MRAPSCSSGSQGRPHCRGRADREHLRRKAKTSRSPSTSRGRGGRDGRGRVHALGLGSPIRIAALHGQGIDELVETVVGPLLAAEDEGAAGLEDQVAVIGRPNVGKSTLINRLVGSNRLVTSPEPGTTRDSVLVQCERGDNRFVLIDTAGIRRRARVSEAVEKYSIVQSLQAVEDAGAVIALLDARAGITDQDTHLIASRPSAAARS